MPISVKSPEVDALLDDVVRLTGESKTEAIGRALRERRDRLTGQDNRRLAHARAFLEAEIWPLVPAAELGRELTRAEEDEVLGYGPEGV